MHGFPYLFSSPGPLTHCRRIGKGGAPQEQGRLITEDILEANKLNSQIPDGVLSILFPWKEVSPVFLIVGTETAEESSDLLVGSLHLTIGLQRIGRWLLPVSP